MKEVVFQLTHEQQKEMVAEVKSLINEKNPLFKKYMPVDGTPFNYTCTSFGELGWYASPATGYKYLKTHPTTQEPFPAFPPCVLSLLEQCRPYLEEGYTPHTCLVNVYKEGSRLGWHKDQTETSRNAIISVSLGADCWFYVGSETEKKILHRFRLVSGDVFILSGEDRMRWHTMAKIIVGTGPGQTLDTPSIGLAPDRRINLTIRQVY